MIGKVTIEPPLTGQVSPIITSLTLDGDNLILAIAGAPNSNFVVKSTTNLSDTTFPTIENTTPAVITTNGSGTASLSVGTAARPALFLRVEQVP